MSYPIGWQPAPFYTPVLGLAKTPLDVVTPHICAEPGCGLVFDDAQGLKDHLTQHTWGPHTIQTNENGSKTFICLGCGKTMTDRKVLRKHLLTHQEKRFLCTFEGCDKKFYERAKLKRHMLVHTGEKAFRCTFPSCDKHFAYKANLKTHLRTHTGLKPFACLVAGCTRTFAQASNRNSHMQTHTRAKAAESSWSDGKESPMLHATPQTIAPFKSIGQPAMDYMPLSLQEFLAPTDPHHLMFQRIPTPSFAQQKRPAPLDLSAEELKSSELYSMLPTPGSFIGNSLFNFEASA